MQKDELDLHKSTLEILRERIREAMEDVRKVYEDRK